MSDNYVTKVEFIEFKVRMEERIRNYGDLEDDVVSAKKDIAALQAKQGILVGTVMGLFATTLSKVLLGG